MALLTTQSISKAGVVPTFGAAAGGGDTVTPGADFLVVKNGDSTSTTVTITPNLTTSYGATLPAHTVTVANATEKWINLRDTAFVNTSTNLITITYSKVTSLTVGAFLV